MRTITTVAQRLNARNIKSARSRKRLPALLAMTDTQRCPDIADIVPILPKNCAVIYRNGDHSNRLNIAQKLQIACHNHGVCLIWAGTIKEATAMRADGLHLRDNPVHRMREIRNHRRQHKNRNLIIAAAHSPQALRHCKKLDVDAVLLSPVFATRSHPGAPYIGITRFRLWCRQAKIPVYALGGITDKTARQLLTTPCIGIAGIDWYLDLDLRL